MTSTFARRGFRHAALLLLAACVRTAPSPIVGTSPEITAADLEKRLFLIADDSMMGRETGSLGAYKATDYIAAEFRRMGLEPAGENGTYFQTVPFWRAAVDPASTMQVAGQTLRVGSDFMPASVFARGRLLSDAVAILGGSMSDTSAWISAEQAAGKIVVIDVPPGMSMRGLAFMTPRWRDALAVAPVVLEQVGAEGIARLRQGRPIPDTTRNPRLVPVLWVSRDAATALLGGNPATLTPGTTGQPIRGHFDIPRSPVDYPARNVVAVLRGSDPAVRGQYLALTAHNDHVGFDRSPVDHDSLRAFNRVVRPMGADSPPRAPTPDEARQIRAILDSLRRVHPPRLDSIRNGADDDGSGTVSILEIAEKLASGSNRPRRSILFVSHTGEEAGLLGSRWFSDHPTVPRDSIVGEIDQDMVGRGTPSDFPKGGTGAGTPDYLEVIGAKRLSREFGEMLESASARQPVPFKFDYTYDQPGHPLQYYCRADHYSYARYGIPSVAMSRGEHMDYHQVTDEPQYISYPDLERVSRMVYDAAIAIGNAPTRPKLDAPKQTDPNAPCRQ